jgi:CubicO group peptidase (beta-lactamase class C family)
MKLVQGGSIKLDDPAYLYVDPFLKKTNDTTLRELWKGDETVEQITIEQLLAMRSGINDYDNKYFKNITLGRPNYDYGPIDLLHDLNKTLAFDPGTQGMYSSMNYELLGLVLAQISNSSSWTDYNLRSAIIKPGSLLDHACKVCMCIVDIMKQVA